MTRLTWTLMAVLAAVAVQASDLEDLVRQSIEDFRSIMTTGSEELDIPVLEPISIRQIPLNINASPLNAKMTVSGIRVTGASGFTLTQVSQIAGTNKVTVAVELPAIDVTAQYDISGRVKIGFFKSKLSGNGPLTVTLRGLRGEGVADVQVNDDGSLHINDLKINWWSWDKLKVDLANLMGGGLIGKTVNTLINKLVPNFVNSNKAKINQLAEIQGKRFINLYLERLAGKKSVHLYQVLTTQETLEWTVTDKVQEILDEMAMLVADSQGETSDVNSTPFEEQVTTLLNNFRDVMKTGRVDFKIPVLDPAVVAKLPIDVKHGPFNAKITALESQVTGVSDFTLTKVSQVEGTNKVDVAIEVPEININGKFEMLGKVKIAVFSHAINDKGPMSINVKGVKLEATVDVLANDDGSYNVKAIDVNSWSFDGIHIQLDNLLGGGQLGKVANDLFNKVFPSLVESDRTKINAWLETMAQNLFNQYLNGLAGKETADIEAKVLEVSEYFRAAMKTGRPDLNIPVMEPITINQLPIHVHRWPLDAQIDVTNIKAAGVSDFKLSRISQIVGTNKVSMDFEIPSISLTCSYDLATIFKMGFVKLDFNKQGPLSLSVTGLKGTAFAELSIATDGSLEQTGLKIDSWSYDNLQVEVGNWVDGGFVKKALNTLLNKLVPALLIKPHADELSAYTAEYTQRLVSRFLDAAAGRVVVANLDVKAGQLLQQLQVVLKNGNAAYDMPVLDPATIAEVPVSFNSLVIDADIVAKNVIVSGISSYTVTKLSQREGTNKLDVEVQVSQDVVGNGDFDVTGKAKLGSFIKYPFEDHGSVLVTIKGLRAVATADMTDRIDGSLALRSLEVTSWTYDEVKTEFANLNNAGKIGQLLNKAVNDLLPGIIKLKHDALTKFGHDAAKAVIDQFLAGVAGQAAQVQVPAAVVTDISPEAEAIIKELAMLAVRSGLAQAA